MGGMNGQSSGLGDHTERGTVSRATERAMEGYIIRLSYQGLDSQEGGGRIMSCVREKFGILSIELCYKLHTGTSPGRDYYLRFSAKKQNKKCFPGILAIIPW